MMVVSQATLLAAMNEPSLYDHPDLYDLVIAPGLAEGFYREEALRHEGGVLELACGTGRLTIALAGSGLDIVGLDSSPTMLASAKDRAKGAGAEVTWVEADMRRFDLGRHFGFIFIATNSLLHLTSAEDLTACLAAAARHLAKGGIFALDVFNPALRILGRDPEQRFEVGRYTHPKHGRILLEETTNYDAAQQISRSTWFFSTPERPDFVTVPLHLRNIFPQELPLVLKRAGLHLEQRFGDFSREPFESRSRHQICLCHADR
ncbi:MAG: class I SAM-dependent methyltransferase [Proteobacteria bacterium]|nr:class I SAM-dependent methyltransferase [Pseudomonadota bacterium]MBI3495876.1 class I SAM-dependent methyltransferase [Pseudomonadota bacterium]